ncbi:MAG: M64 family metallopeptidase [Bacteroidales bacterium]|jgi:hypothetical protein
MKFLRYIFLLGNILFLLGSCSLFEKPTLEVSESIITLNNKSDNARTVEISSNQTWSIKNTSNWVILSSRNGEGDAIITITASYNNKEEERETQLTVTTDADSPITAYITIRQPKSYFNITPSSLSFEKEGGNQSISIESNVAWNIKATENYPLLSFSSTSGSDDNSIIITSAVNEERLKKQDTVLFSYAGLTQTLIVSHNQQPNIAPEKPKILSPGIGEINVPRLPVFSWESSDKEGDELVSTIYYSLDKKKWIAFDPTTDFSIKMETVLKGETEYYWFVSIDDGHSGITNSDTVSFTTTNYGVHGDGTYVTYQQSTKSSPCKIIFIGDGFTDNSLLLDGEYDKYIDGGIEAFFSVEPYKSYRNYFTVYKMYASSQEEGASFPAKNVYKNTTFSTRYTGEGTGMQCENEKVFEYAAKIDGVNTQTVLVVLVVNERTYGGTCWMWTSGRSIAICPLSNKMAEEGSMTNFHSIILHEAGGHGWSKLADEYISSENSGKSITDDTKQNLSVRQTENDWYSNVSLIRNVDSVQWAAFIGRKGYEPVNMYEGAYYYSYGVWRPEPGSCMINNIHYYNAPSRYAIVKRIFKEAGEDLTFEKFIENDIKSGAAAAAITKSTVDKNFIPLAPPVVIVNN